MTTKNPAELYPWSSDLDASSDVRVKEREGYAMLLGWLEKFFAGSGLPPSREACERFLREQVRAKPREKWQLDQWGAAMRWDVRWLEHRFANGGEVRSLPERLRDAVNRVAGLAGASLPEALLRKHLHGGQKWPRQYFFPAAKPSRYPQSGLIRRHSIGEDACASAIRRAVEEAMIDKNATSHAFRHAFVGRWDGSPDNPDAAGPRGC